MDTMTGLKKIQTALHTYNLKNSQKTIKALLAIGKFLRETSDEDKLELPELCYSEFYLSFSKEFQRSY